MTTSKTEDYWTQRKQLLIRAAVAEAAVATLRARIVELEAAAREAPAP